MTIAHTTEYYMNNCVSRILMSACQNKNIHRRNQDIAHAATIAAEDGMEKAYDYLIWLCNAAEQGKYS